MIFHVGSNQTGTSDTKIKTHSTLVVCGQDDIRSTCHIPIVGPMGDASGPTYENHTKASDHHERVPADHAGQRRKNRVVTVFLVGPGVTLRGHRGSTGWFGMRRASRGWVSLTAWGRGKPWAVLWVGGIFSAKTPAAPWFGGKQNRWSWRGESDVG